MKTFIVPVRSQISFSFESCSRSPGATTTPVNFCFFVLDVLMLEMVNKSCWSVDMFLYCVICTTSYIE